MKKLFLATVLALTVSTAWGQSVVRVKQLGADYTVSTVTFRVYWDTQPDGVRHLDSVWLFVDYQPIAANGSLGAWTPATLTNPTATSPGTVVAGSLNGRGFYLRGTPAAGFSSEVTVKLDGLNAGDRFNWCAYASDYPPNATEDTGYYELHGTPPFLINGTITEPTRHYAGCITALTDRTGCPGLIPVSPVITSFTASTDSLCTGESVTLEITADHASLYSFNGGQDWIAGTGAVTTNDIPTADATYTPLVKNAASCTATFTPIPVTVSPLPSAVFNNAPETLCAGDSITLTVGDGSGSYCFLQHCSACVHNPYASGNDDPTEYDCIFESATCTFGASNSYTFTASDSGNVTVCVRVVNARGCLDSACVTIAVTPLPPAPALSGGGTLCASNTALSCFGETGYSYQLQDGLTQAVGASLSGANALLNFPITASGAYTVVATDATTGCVITSDPQEVSLSIPPVAPAALTANASLCAGVSATLTASGGNGGSGAVYEWGEGTVVGDNPLSPATTTAATRPISVTASVSYWVRLIGTTTCTDTTNGAVLTMPVTGIDYGYTTVNCNGSPLDVQNQDANGGQTTCWAPNNLCPPGWRWPTIEELEFLTVNRIISLEDRWSIENYDSANAYYLGVAASTSQTGCLNYQVQHGVVPGTNVCVSLSWFSCVYSFCGYGYGAIGKTHLFKVRCVR
jgi:hypothetical protein